MYTSSPTGQAQQPTHFLRTKAAERAESLRPRLIIKKNSKPPDSLTGCRRAAACAGQTYYPSQASKPHYQSPTDASWAHQPTPELLPNYWSCQLYRPLVLKGLEVGPQDIHATAKPYICARSCTALPQRTHTSTTSAMYNTLHRPWTACSLPAAAAGGPPARHTVEAERIHAD